MTEHFRIIQLPAYPQVLLTRDFDDDEESTSLLVITFFLDGVKINQKLGFNYENERDEAFVKFSLEDAQSAVDHIKNMINDGGDEEE